MQRAAEHRLCLRYDIGWSVIDASPRSLSPNILDFDGYDAGEDYGRRDDPDGFAPARMLVQVRDSTGVLWGWRPIGADGCTGFFDTLDAIVSFQYVNWSFWRDTGNHIAAIYCGADDCTMTRDELDVPVPQTTDIELTIAMDQPQPRIMLWGLAFSEQRHPHGRDRLTYAVHYNDAAAVMELAGYPEATTGDIIGRNATVMLRGFAHRRKYTLAHEYGHAVTLGDFITTHINDPGADYCYSQVTCTASHDWTSLEYQSAAAVEGYADYYALAVWNELFEGVGYRFDTDGAKFFATHATDDPITSAYIANTCNHALNCLPGIGVQRDWAFFLWDLTSGPSPVFSATEVLRLPANAYPWPINTRDASFWANFNASAASAHGAAQMQAFNWRALVRGVDN